MHFLKKIASQYTCLTDTSCFAIYKKSYCFKYKENTESIDPKISSTTSGRAMILSKCAICSSKKSRLIKHKEPKGLLNKLGIKTLLNKMPILGDILY